MASLGEASSHILVNRAAVQTRAARYHTRFPARRNRHLPTKG
jgi:hypothetical protein